jgi:DNA-binding NarL/FixJ family response regulator
MVVLGLTNGEIAHKLRLSESTVKSHLSSSFTKLGVRSRGEAASLILDPAAGLGTGILVISED